MRRRQEVPVPQALEEQITAALLAVQERGRAVDEAVASPLEERRQLRAGLREAYDAADEVLRRATALTRGRSHTEWSRWRKRLAVLSTARQKALFEERDDMVALGLGTVQAVDTGMSGPSIGELQHGRSKAPGTPARYGLDVDAVRARTGTGCRGVCAEGRRNRFSGPCACRLSGREAAWLDRTEAA